MLTSLPARWLADHPALVAFAASAQNSAMPNDAASPAPSESSIYRSAMEGYTPFRDEAPIPWRAANDTVQLRGGWRAYAKEATGDDPHDTKSPHAGHAKTAP